MSNKTWVYITIFINDKSIQILINHNFNKLKKTKNATQDNDNNTYCFSPYHSQIQQLEIISTDKMAMKARLFAFENHTSRNIICWSYSISLNRAVLLTFFCKTLCFLIRISEENSPFPHTFHRIKA